ATGEVIDGPAGDFDPGVGSSSAGVNIAAGNDPTTVTLTMSPSATTVALGQPVTVAMAATYAPYAYTSSYNLDWGDGNSSGTSYTYLPTGPVPSDSYTASHTSASAGTYARGGLASGSKGGPPGYATGSLTVTVVAPPAALAPGASFAPNPGDPVGEPAG